MSRFEEVVKKAILEVKYDYEVPEEYELRRIFCNASILAENIDDRRLLLQRAMYITSAFASMLVSHLKAMTHPNRPEIIEGIKFYIDIVDEEDQEIFFSISDGDSIYLRLADILFLLTDKGFQAVLHEVIHYLDYNRIKPKTSIPVASGKNPIEYFNSPLEFNAFINQFSFYLLRHLEKFARINKIEYKKTKDKRFVSNYIRKIIPDILKRDDTYGEFLRSLTSNNLKKVYRRVFELLTESLTAIPNIWTHEIGKYDLKERVLYYKNLI